MQVEVQSKVWLPYVAVRQFVFVKLCRIGFFTTEKLLHAGVKFGAAHGWPPKIDLIETICPFHPVTTTVVRAGVFGAQVQRCSHRLPCKMKSEGVSAIFL